MVKFMAGAENALRASQRARLQIAGLSVIDPHVTEEARHQDQPRGGMAAALEANEQLSQRMGLRDSQSVERAISWLKANRLHRFATSNGDLDLRIAIARLLDESDV